jgi:hypothetical protein
LIDLDRGARRRGRDWSWTASGTHQQQLFFALHQFPDVLESLIEGVGRNMTVDGVDQAAGAWGRIAKVLDEAKAAGFSPPP